MAATGYGGGGDEVEELAATERVILVNLATQGTVVVSSDLAAAVQGMVAPASMVSLGPVAAGERGGEECAVCLEWLWREEEEEEEVKEMACGHRFHGGCIERWLRVGGSCPLCRHRITPGRRRDVWMTLSFGGSRGGDRRPRQGIHGSREEDVQRD